MTREELFDGYITALKRESDRSHHRRKTQQGKFESSFVHIDFQEVGLNERDERQAWISDGGRGAAAIRSFDEQGRSAQQCIRSAREKVRREDRRLVGFFNLFVRHDGRRNEIIEAICRARRCDEAAARRHYWSRMKKVSKILNAQ